MYSRRSVRTCPSRLGMSNVTLRNVNLLRLGINLLRLGMYITAHARKSTGSFTACAKARADGRLLDGKTTTLEREPWRARRRAVAAAMARARQDLRVRIPTIYQ